MTEDERSTEELFAEYRAHPTEELKWRIVLRYTDMIKRIALRIRGVYSGFAQIDDIINEGLIVLAGAVDKYDPSRGKFETFVGKRIRGMIIDLARRQDWVPRPTRQRAREIDKAYFDIYSETGQTPTDHQMAERLNVTDEDYLDMLTKTSVCNVVSLEEALDNYEQIPSRDEDTDEPQEALENEDLIRMLTEAIGTLRENEQLVLSLYYEKDMKMKDIAAVMGVSFARVSQIHARAIQKLKQKLIQE